MYLSTPRVVIGLLGLLSGLVGAQTENRCAAAQRALEVVIKEYPDKAVETLISHVRGNADCAGPLVSSAIAASQADDEMVAELVTAAVRAAPEKAVAIAESAILAAPTASDEVAEVVQVILGDCQSIGEDVAISIGRNRERLLIVIEDALRRHSNCACEIVSAAVRAANGSEAVIAQIVETAVTVKPAQAAEIAECAMVAAPQMASAVQAGLDGALKDSSRGPGALPAAAESLPDSEEVEERATEAPERTYSDGTSAASVSPPGDGEERPGYGKNGSGKNEVVPVPVKKEEEEEEWGWDWIHWGNIGGNGGAVYMIVPSGGIIPPGIPLSPSDLSPSSDGYPMSPYPEGEGYEDYPPDGDRSSIKK